MVETMGFGDSIIGYNLDIGIGVARSNAKASNLMYYLSIRGFSLYSKAKNSNWKHFLEL